jgi:hypothetical protein
MTGTNDGAGEHAEVGADVEQTDHNGLNAGEQCKGGSWVALKEAAALLGVSIDTVKRRMQRGEVEARRETIPQGFRWLVFVELAKNDAAGSILSDENHNRGVQLPPDSSDIVAALLRQLEGRNQEIARLHETIASLSRAVEHMGQMTATVGEETGDPGASSGASVSDHPDDQDGDESAGLWARLRRFLTG